MIPKKKYDIIKFIFTISLFSLFIFLISFKLLGGLIGYGDYPYYFSNNHSGFFYLWSDSMLGNSLAGFIFGFPIISQFPYFFRILGLSDNIISYLLNFVPILITSLTTYYIIKKISGNAMFGYFSGLFIIMNNFILEQLIFWPGHYFYNVISLIILFYISYNIYMFGLTWRTCIYLILNSILIIHPFFLVMYISYLFLFFIFYFFFIRKNIFSFLFVIILGTLSIHFYWLIPFISNLFNQSVQNIYNGNQSPILYGYMSMANYVNLFNYFNYIGTLALKLHQGTLQYFFYFGLLCSIAFVLIKSKTKGNTNIYIIFLASIYLIFFTLALGPNSKLTGNLWMWAFNNVPGFGFFRSFTRFLIISLISVIFLFAVFIKQWILRIEYKNFIFLCGIILLIYTNLIFLTGDLAGTIGKAEIPQEYVNINEKYFSNDSNKFSIISYPNTPYESYTWSVNKNIQVFPQIIYFNLYFFSKPIAYNGFAFFLDQKNNLFKKVFAFNYNFEYYNEFDQDLSSLNIRYVIVHKDLFDVLNIDKKVEYEKYYEYFKNNQKYILKEDNEYYALFEIKNFQPLLRGNSIFFKSINPTKYKLYIKNMTSVQDISFMRSFHNEWKLYLKPMPTNSWCQELEDYKNTNIIECQHTKNFFESEELSYLYQKPIFDNTHKIVYEYANGWTIDPKYIKKNFSKEYYKENPDGSIDIELILYFKPQSYFYLGLIISSLTLLICSVYLIYHWRKRTSILIAII